MILLKSVFLIAIVAVAMIGVMVPSVFADQFDGVDLSQLELTLQESSLVESTDANVLIIKLKAKNNSNGEISGYVIHPYLNSGSAVYKSDYGYELEEYGVSRYTCPSDPTIPAGLSKNMVLCFVIPKDHSYPFTLYFYDHDKRYCGAGTVYACTSTSMSITNTVSNIPIVAPTPSSQENNSAAEIQNYLDYLGISAFNMNQNTELKPYSQLSKYSDYEKGFSINYPSSLEISENYQSALGGLGWVKFSNDPVIDIFNFSVYGYIPITYTDDQSLMQQQLQYMSNLAEEQNMTFELIDQYVIEENDTKHFFISSIVTDDISTWFDLNDWVLVEDKIIQTNSSINVTIIGLLVSINPELKKLYVGGELVLDYLQKAHQDILLSFTVNINSNEEPNVKVTSTSNCGSGTEDVNGICQVIQTKEKSNGGGCLIATATYGSELAPQVQQLRELRDNQLLNTESGTAFMGTFNDIYYSFSPIIADYERENPLFKEAVKLAITPLISSLSVLNYVDMDSESEVLGYGISLILLNLGMYLGVPAIVVVGIKRKF